MASSKLMLNMSRQLKNGTYPLVMQLIHQRRKRVIYSGLYLHVKEYDSTIGIVIKCKQKYRLQKDISHLNVSIKIFKDSIEKIIYNLDHSGKVYRVDDIVNYYELGQSDDSLVKYWHNYIVSLTNDGRIGMANAQKYTLNSILSFTDTSNIRLSKIDSTFVQKYQRYLQSKQVSHNTISYYMRNLKSLLRKASNDLDIDKSIVNSFEGIRTNPQKTVKRALSRDKLKELLQLREKSLPDIAFSIDLFMYSFYTRGMAFVDIAFLSKDNIVGETICYTRKKTKQYLQIGINSSIKEILDRYIGVSHYIFPLIESLDPVIAYHQYRSSLRRINKSLKLVSEQLGLVNSLTTYVARHSWATQAKERGFPISVISEGLGHTSEKITQIYLKEFEQNVLDKANDEIIKL